MAAACAWLREGLLFCVAAAEAWSGPDEEPTAFCDMAVLLLRSSDSVVHDLCHAYNSCNDMTLSRPSTFFLALRKWYPSLCPEMEFRCFVRSRLLVGISQREVTGFYPVLLEKKNNLKMMIRDFFTDEVSTRFESENYTIDVYITTDGRVKLLDFNPWAGDLIKELSSVDLQGHGTRFYAPMFEEDNSDIEDIKEMEGIIQEPGNDSITTSLSLQRSISSPKHNREEPDGILRSPDGKKIRHS
ncbi:hypothetical protein RJ639_010392 [Escallonia herrerae]|uniref:Cell division cycle protein 123 homolog n=1 Tax=Escallonia herrerae TaxID=1293975 RepID=A0AA88VTR3_9ASTE|nr:hypothetical protein RJ639_010392 [Escallonia herrerae]